ncbi:MAG: trypsin-like serine protease [Hyphomonas sp.]|nr:trypsin-like serine protease [Hyphomonas sp.]
MLRSMARAALFALIVPIAAGCAAAPAGADPTDADADLPPAPFEDEDWPRSETVIPPATSRDVATKGLNTSLTKPGDWQFFAALRGTRNGTVTYDCGGSVISPDWVLTAAHCVEGASKNAAGVWERPGSGALEIVIGRHDLKKVAAGDVRRAIDVRIADGYARAGDGDVPVNDVALVRLDRPWDGATIRLSASTDSDVDSFFGAAYFAGFGKTNMFDSELGHFTSDTGPFDAYTDRLRNAMIPTRAPEACKDVYNVEAYEGATMICAGYDSGIVDSCQGDSGGPLIARDFAGRVYLMGIVSHGESCGVRRAPAVYARVSGFRTFIEGVVPEAVFVEAKPERAIYMTKAGLENLMKTLAPAEGKVSVSINDGATNFNEGDSVAIRISPEIRGRVWVFDLDPAGVVNCLFPCTLEEKDVSVKDAGARVSIPEDADAGVRIRVSRPEVDGENKLVAFVLPEAMALIGDTIPDLGQTKGKLRPLWKSYSEILVYEARDAMGGDTINRSLNSDPYANTGMGVVTYTVN